METEYINYLMEDVYPGVLEYNMRLRAIRPKKLMTKKQEQVIGAIHLITGQSSKRLKHMNEDKAIHDIYDLHKRADKLLDFPFGFSIGTSYAASRLINDFIKIWWCETIDDIFRLYRALQPKRIKKNVKYFIRE